MPEELLLDVASLEAPLPLQISLRGASHLKSGQYIKMFHRMKPCHLFTFLEQLDIWWADFELSSEQYIVFMAKSNDIQTIEYLKGNIADEYDRIVT